MILVDYCDVRNVFRFYECLNMVNFETVPNLLGLASIAFAALAKLLNTPPTTAAKPIDTKTINDE